MKTGVELIAYERQRQVIEEGFDDTHDDEHINGTLALVAACFASPIQLFRLENHRGNKLFKFVDPWPQNWSLRWDRRRVLPNPSLRERIDLLVKSGALAAAEIDRLQRAIDGA